MRCVLVCEPVGGGRAAAPARHGQAGRADVGEEDRARLIRPVRRDPPAPCDRQDVEVRSRRTPGRSPARRRSSTMSSSSPVGGGGARSHRPHWATHRSRRRRRSGRRGSAGRSVEHDDPRLVVVERAGAVRVARDRAREGVDVVDRAAVGREGDAVATAGCRCAGSRRGHRARRAAAPRRRSHRSSDERADDEPALRVDGAVVEAHVAARRRAGRGRTRRHPSGEIVASPRAAATSSPPSSARATAPAVWPERRPRDVDDPRDRRARPESTRPSRCRPSARDWRGRPRSRLRRGRTALVPVAVRRMSGRALCHNSEY